MRKLETKTLNDLYRQKSSAFIRLSKAGVRCWMFALCLLANEVSPASADLQQYDSKYYTIYTDLPAEDEKEVAIRMTRMADEYHNRTSNFSGAIRTKFPFYLFSSAEDYYRAGGMRNTAGEFMASGNGGGRLMAIAGRRPGQETWHTVQHEGFHQFANAVIGGQIPTWLNEGLAEYFGESIFTGDGFVTGVVPPWRLTRLKDEIDRGEFKSLQSMMHVSPDQWADEMTMRNYDQAWSMVYFLVHGDDQKYQSAFGDCITGISRGKPFDRAWADSIGSANGFETRWKQWWLAQPESPTRLLYARAAVATMTSFVARASAQKQSFVDFNAFKIAVDKDELKISPQDWLPRSLIATVMREYGSLPSWELSPGINKQPTVTLTIFDGTRVTGSFKLLEGKVDQVSIEVDDLARQLNLAQGMLNVGKKKEARDKVLAAIKQNPRSVAMSDARKFLHNCQ